MHHAMANTHHTVVSDSMVARYVYLFMGVLAVSTVGALVLAYLYTNATRTLQTVQSDRVTLQSTYDTAVREHTDSTRTLEMRLASTSEVLRQTEEARATYQRKFEEKEEEVNELSRQVKKISGTVGVLDKLAKTDPELLMKYSKVYFLNEHYTPGKLSKIEATHSAVTTDQYLEARVYDQLETMLEDAKEDAIDIKVRSAYRSFDAQKNLKSAYTVSYGSGANTFAADQGYSEHQLGTTVDLTSPESGNQLAGFDTTKAFAWLQKHAHTYGFVLSYPKGNAYYIYEPWHWRYVGTKLATDLHEDGKFFYDLDQREIDKYLVEVFE
jgi:zinc D-Ala-D-Ala carboxypeptidase